jgi:hypothetical protein
MIRKEEKNEGLDCLLEYFAERHQKLLPQTTQYQLGDYFPSFLDINAIHPIAQCRNDGNQKSLAGVNGDEHSLWHDINAFCYHYF